MHHHAPAMMLVLSACLVALVGPRPLAAFDFPAGIDHQPWQQLIERHVDADGQIAYAAWGAAAADVAALDQYLAAYAVKPGAGNKATGADRHAGIINLYNAVTVREVIRQRPAKSFWDLKPFDKKDHLVGGEKVSLNDIEHNAGRPEIGYRVHAALVCAAKSCPPLPRQAFTATNLEAMLDERMRLWLADSELNKFDAGRKTVQLSKIFEWFKGDFEKPGLGTILAEHGPAELKSFLAGVSYDQVSYVEYDTALNKQ